MSSMIPWLAKECEQHLLNEKWLLAEDLRIAQQWKDRLNLAGYSSINLHAKTIRSLTAFLSGSLLAESQLTFIGEAATRMMIHALLRQSVESKELEYFGQVVALDALAELVAQSIGDLRLAELTPQDLKTESFGVSAKGRDVWRIFDGFCSRLEEQRLADYAICLKLVTSGLENGSLRLPQRLLLLVPEKLDLTAAEERLLRALESRVAVTRPKEHGSFSEPRARQRIAASVASGSAKFHYFCGLGEVNEVRGVLQRVLSRKPSALYSFDNVEILHTDYRQYVPLLLELLATWQAGHAWSNDHLTNDVRPSVDALPITFAEGIACVYSRPGRALRGWLRWARCDFVQTKAVQLIREGLLARPDSAQRIGYGRLANALRRLSIGFKSERYLSKLEQAIEAAQRSLTDDQSAHERDAIESAANAQNRDFGLPTLRALQAMLEPLVELAPDTNDPAATVLEKAKQFLTRCARAENKLDHYARSKLVDEIDGMLITLRRSPVANMDVRPWLEALPLESRILASGPQPGCIHVAPLARGGHTGRRQLFVIGLDDTRYPKRARIDPILLDHERIQLSAELPTSSVASDSSQHALSRVLFRCLAEDEAAVYLSCATRNLAEDRSAFPSSALLETFRLTQDRSDAHLDDLLTHMGPAVSFISASPVDHLDESDAEVAALLNEPRTIRRQEMLEEKFNHWTQCRVAAELKAAAPMSGYDGWVPAAGPILNPAGQTQRVSASRLETFGACPRRFFFKYGIGVSPPDEWSLDPEGWLNALEFGNLVHGLFEDFLRAQTAQDRIPNFERDLQPLRDLLHDKVERLKRDVPAPNEDAFRRQCDLLEEVCEIFLRKEEAYCHANQARPWVLEASLGLHQDPQTELDCSEPIALTLSDGRLIQVGGRIDRVDKLMVDGSERYAIWDYKSGSDAGFEQQDPFQQGRKLQPYLYIGMLRHRISAMKGDPAAVQTFGYFFPNPRTEGRRLQWTHGELKRGDEVLRHICNLIQHGLFLATTNPNDCRYCDYRSVCGDPETVARESLCKSLETCNGERLHSWVQLREIDQSTMVNR